MNRQDGLVFLSFIFLFFFFPGFKCITRFSFFQENSFGYEHFCYTYVQQKSTWNNAESSCASKGGHLLAITDRYELEPYGNY